jgi:hypothetical protein
MYIRMRDASTSIINIDFGNGNPCLSDDDNIESPQIIIQTKPDLERILNGSYLRQFTIEIENNSNPLLYDTSNKHVNILSNRKQTKDISFSYLFVIMKVTLSNYLIMKNGLAEDFGRKNLRR